MGLPTEDEHPIKQYEQKSVAKRLLKMLYWQKVKTW